jgi:hypothetical protein
MRVQQGLRPRQGSTVPKGVHTITRGVVINVYYPEEETRPGVTGAARGAQRISALSADVLGYGGSKRFFWRKIPVAQPRHGLIDYDLWVPRATTRNIETNETLRLPDASSLDIDKIQTADPRSLDGDHVLVDMLEGDPQQAFVRYDQLPHPNAEYRLARADNLVQRSRVRGVIQTIDGKGNVTIDTTRANDGSLGTPATETPAGTIDHGALSFLVNRTAEFNVVATDENGANLTYQFRMQPGGMLVQLEGGVSLQLSGEGATATLQLGDGLVAAVREDLLNALWGQMVTWLQAHTHATGVGPSAPPTEFATVPTWNSAIASTKLTFPEG